MTMDLRSASVDPIIEHVNVTVHSMVPKFTMREETMGGFLEFIDVFEVAAGVRGEPHFHDSHEFYFILEGQGIMQIEMEAQLVGPDTLIHIPRNARHTMRILDRPLRALSLSVSYQEPYDPGYHPCDLPEVLPPGVKL
jgi:quercetin dioxygenase-like cupin family protein